LIISPFVRGVRSPKKVRKLNLIRNWQQHNAKGGLPRRKMALAVFQEAVRRGELRTDIDLEATIDLLYAPMYYRLQMGTGPLSDAYIDRLFDQAMDGLLQRKN
jgi:hypothetical protein